MTKNDEVVSSKWKKMKGINNVTNLLKALRNKVAHACDPYPDVSKNFENDFRKTKDTYMPQKFLDVFLSQCPALLIHLFDFYKNNQKLLNSFPEAIPENIQFGAFRRTVNKFCTTI